MDFSAIDLRSSMAALVATEPREEGAGAKAAADPIKRERRESFMVNKELLLLCGSCESEQRTTCYVSFKLNMTTANLCP